MEVGQRLLYASQEFEARNLSDLKRMPPETLSDPTAGELKGHWG